MSRERLRRRSARPAGERLLIALNKPYDVLCQFSCDQGRATLKNYVELAGVYPAGRLDRDSEGLVLLTNDGRLQARIAEPRFGLEKTYWVQVEGVADERQLQQLAAGIQLKDGLTRPARVRSMAEPELWPRDPPVRFRRHIPTSWLELVISEGKNRQVRRMTAAVGLPCLRLVRVKIGRWSLGELQPGQWCRLAIKQARS